jgi:hypothetical protein
VGERTDFMNSASLRGEGGSGPDLGSGDRPDSAVIAEEIEQTRAAMSETVGTIQRRLDPDRLSEQAISTASEVTEQAVSAATDVTHQAKDAAVEVTEQARDAAKEVARYAIDEAKTAVRELADQATNAVRESTVGRVEQVAGYTRDTAQSVQTDLFTTIKQNPLPAAMAAIGIGWLWSRRASGGDSMSHASYGDRSAGWSQMPYAAETRSAHPVSGRLEDAGGQAQQMAGQVLDQVQERAGLMQEKAGQVQEQVGQIPSQIPMKAGQMQQQAQGFWQMLETNPVAVGALGVALGGFAGLMLPETERERQLMGETRDRVIENVQQAAGQTIGTVQHVAQDAVTAAADEVKSQTMVPHGDSASASMR